MRQSENSVFTHRYWDVRWEDRVNWAYITPTKLILNFMTFKKDKSISLVFDKHYETYFILQLISISWTNMNVYTINVCEPTPSESWY